MRVSAAKGNVPSWDEPNLQNLVGRPVGALASIASSSFSRCSAVSSRKNAVAPSGRMIVGSSALSWQ